MGFATKPNGWSLRHAFLKDVVSLPPTASIFLQRLLPLLLQSAHAKRHSDYGSGFATLVVVVVVVWVVGLSWLNVFIETPLPVQVIAEVVKRNEGKE
jgi:hypothetical protein